ncbi:oxidoreductase, 2OG-Fe(II) oxygenase family [Aspergillus affinis]|uniref:oxidoreductase, 2OG-Fe(II) oxygenase family n=1 Tax=Aspergillus affinis TaxID=1070780 RepID=UPI0022FF02E3|nr:oxidoreductase [Aspergillus affinis]KAI9045479.1 oxidoreductase [Aspergillus affinis]
MIKLSTLFSSFFYLLPLYIFVVAPLLRQLFPSDFASSSALDFDSTDHDPDVTLDESVLSLDDGVEVTCPPEAEQYRVHLLARDPLVIYIENFVSGEEADEIVEMSKTNYTPSILYNGSASIVDPSRRLSDRALLPRTPAIRCLEARARAFQGWRPNLYIERMWAQRYNASGHYTHHYDWAGSVARGGDRASTFMVYLGAECTGGGTNFPRLRKPRDTRWCEFIECDESGYNEVAGEEGQEGGEKKGTRREGITFKPIKGNAIFWENLRADGSGYPETWHAAEPVTEGTKFGLNIWSWYQAPRRRV